MTMQDGDHGRLHRPFSRSSSTYLISRATTVKKPDGSSTRDDVYIGCPQRQPVKRKVGMGIITLGFGAASALENRRRVGRAAIRVQSEAGSYGSTDEWAGQISGQVIADALLLASSALRRQARDGLSGQHFGGHGPTLPGLIAATGTGAKVVVITIDDGTNPLEAARIRLTQGVETYVGSANANGQVTFNVNDATWTIAITKAGYTYAGTTLTVVDGDKTPTYSMTAVSFSASAPGQSTGWVYCYDGTAMLKLM